MKKILIIGANSAIAEATARIWAQEGHRLFLVARDASRLQANAADLKIRGAEATFSATLDVLDFAAHEAVLRQATEAMDGLDIALIAHGTLGDQAACERDAGLALREFNTNATSVLLLLTRLANLFEAQRHGTIAVISSVAGDRCRRSNYVYGAAKATVSAFCEGLRARLLPAGVSVVDLRPGMVETPMTRGLPLPAALVAQPEPVARGIVRGIANRAPVVYLPGFWALIMLIIRNIPRPLFVRMKL